MSLKMIDHPLLLLPFLLLAVSFLQGGNVGWALMALAFWLVVYISLTGDARIERGRIVVRIGRPVPLAIKEIPLDEVVEVIKLPSASGVRLIEQFQRPWVPLGNLVIGVSIGALFLHRGEFYGLLWIYVSILSALNFLFRPSEKRNRVLASVVVSLLTVLALLYMGRPEFVLVVALYGLFDATFANENYGQDAVIIRTERERIVFLGDSTATEGFMENIKSLLSAGGSNVPAP
ncbi:hypothetical protein [Thermococcus sp. 21S9]|uniref:hypothetical protein n=1 Tax=Thermococcus sp. 21S9 TaxID=1638223 RepID=UPI00143C21CA|nr:hypothetical protein [Thermococcus sp. 21S9]NJE54685.1 hypothetical protein [Thermococcus sp. 21S9]